VKPDGVAVAVVVAKAPVTADAVRNGRVEAV
jgi:hypothetical protein